MYLKILEPKEYHRYYSFYKSVYKNYENKKDSMEDILHDILKNKSEINVRMKIKPLLVYMDDKPVMGTVLAQVSSMDDYIQMSFFESKIENYEAFLLLLKETEKTGIEWQAKQISASLNIHVNYGLGFLNSHFDKSSSFGMNYNPEFYNFFFRKTSFEQIDLVTYKCDMKDFKLPVSDKILNRVNKSYSVRTSNFKDFKNDIKIYTQLNNNAFKEHLFYYNRQFKEDYELFKPFKWLLKEENLLIVEKNHKPVGFMFWYPDFNELIPNGKNLSIKTVFDYKILTKKISTFKIVEIGVIDTEQKKGAILALFSKLQELVYGRFDYCESSWILKDNTDSSNFGYKWSDGEYKTFAAYTRPTNA